MVKKKVKSEWLGLPWLRLKKLNMGHKSAMLATFMQNVSALKLTIPGLIDWSCDSAAWCLCVCQVLSVTVWHGFTSYTLKRYKICHFLYVLDLNGNTL